MNRSDRTAAEARDRAIRCEGRKPEDCPNAPCSRCQTPLMPQYDATSHLIENGTHPPRPAEWIDLCPSCYTDLMDWLDIEPAHWRAVHGGAVQVCADTPVPPEGPARYRYIYEDTIISRSTDPISPATDCGASAVPPCAITEEAADYLT